MQEMGFLLTWHDGTVRQPHLVLLGASGCPLLCSLLLWWLLRSARALDIALRLPLRSDKGAAVGHECHVSSLPSIHDSTKMDVDAVGQRPNLLG